MKLADILLHLPIYFLLYSGCRTVTSFVFGALRDKLGNLFGQLMRRNNYNDICIPQHISKDHDDYSAQNK